MISFSLNYLLKALSSNTVTREAYSFNIWTAGGGREDTIQSIENIFFYLSKFGLPISPNFITKSKRKETLFHMTDF